MPLSDYDPPKPDRKQCRHILTSGHRCQSPCLKSAATGDEPFCYYHHTTRHPVTGLKTRRARQSTFELPLIEDRSAIQAAINEILSRIASNDLDPRRAGLLLYGLQIASLNQSAQEAANRPRNSSRYASEDHTHTVLEITEDPEFGLLAPIADYAEPGDAPGRKSLGRRLGEALDRAKAEAAQRVAAAQAREEAQAKAAAEAEAKPEPATEERPGDRTLHPDPTAPVQTETEAVETPSNSAEPLCRMFPAPEPGPALRSNDTESNETGRVPPDRPQSKDLEDPQDLEAQAHGSTLSKVQATADPEAPDLPHHPRPSEAKQPTRKPTPRTHRYLWPSNSRSPGTARPSHKTQKPRTPPSRWPYHR